MTIFEIPRFTLIVGIMSVIRYFNQHVLIFYVVYGKTDFINTNLFCRTKENIFSKMVRYNFFQCIIEIACL